MPITTAFNHTADLDKGAANVLLRQPLSTLDANAHVFVVEASRGSEPANLTGARCEGWFVRADGVTVPIDGAVDGSTATVTLLPACYAVPGRFALAVKLALGDVIHTILRAEGSIDVSRTDALTEGGTGVQSFDEIVASLDAIFSAAESAGTDAQRAEDAAASIIGSVEAAQDAATRAEAAAERAEQIGGTGGGSGTVGVSPTVDVNKSGKVTTLTITDAEGVKTATINDGVDGKTPVKGTDYWTEADKAEIITELGTSAAVPGYVTTEAETVARIVHQHQSGDSIVFPFLADAHCGFYQDKANTATALAGQLLDQIGQRIPYDFIANGGDMANGAWDTTREMTYEQYEDYAQLTSAAHKGVPSVWVPGNHDDAPYRATADRVTQKELFSLIGRKNRLSGAECPNGCNYGYLDLDNRRLRVICLDTHDRRSWGSINLGSGQDCTYLNIENISGTQLRWLAEHALDFTGKANPADWGIVVVSHAALNANGTWMDPVSSTNYAVNTANAAAILNAYNAGSSGTISHNGITVTYDFSAADSRAAVICCVHGHNHKFSSETVSGILSIGCPNVMNGRERASDDGNTYAKTAGTADGTSFCIITIDRENQLIYADCVGAGYDRQFEYTTEVVTYTNQLPISTDASGNVYNDKGWKEDTYLSSGNEGTKAGIYTTGFIPVAPGSVLHCRNVGMQTAQDSHRICVYDATKTFLVIAKTTVTEGWWTWGDDGNIAKITINKTNNPNAAFIRLCCGYLGDDSIITVNEEIV